VAAAKNVASARRRGPLIAGPFHKKMNEERMGKAGLAMADFTAPLMSAAAANPVTECAQRRLQAMGKVLNHDFPNQLVVIQGLLQLLLEEDKRLSADGREYLRRLCGAATRALDMAQGLKTLARLRTGVDRSERVELKELAEELAADIKKLCPGTVFEYHLPREPVAVRASRLPLYQALVELSRATAAVAGSARVVLEAEPTAAGVEISIAPQGPAAPTSSAATVKPEPKSWESRLEFLLARELVEIAGGTLRADDSPGRDKFFYVLVPDAGMDSGGEGAAL
jgi:signal transduction histidine kinase